MGELRIDPVEWPQKVIHGAVEIEVVPFIAAKEALAENQRLRALLHRWLLAASAMGGGPRAVLTQDTLDAVGMPDV